MLLPPPRAWPLRRAPMVIDGDDKSRLVADALLSGERQRRVPRQRGRASPAICRAARAGAVDRHGNRRHAGLPDRSREHGRRPYRRGALPQKGGANAQAMFDTPRRAYVLLNAGTRVRRCQPASGPGRAGPGRYRGGAVAVPLGSRAAIC
ncbi:hypothetical protein ACU4GD_42315 [Cupriavidus basilensis]